MKVLGYWESNDDMPYPEFENAVSDYGLIGTKWVLLQKKYGYAEHLPEHVFKDFYNE